MVFYLESCFSWLWGGVQKTLKKKRKQAEEKHWKVKRKKNEEYEESQITTIYIFIGFKLYFARKHILKTICLYLYTIPWNFIYSFYALQDVWNTVMIHQSSIYINIQVMIKICINRLSTTTQMFIAMDYSIMMSEK